MCSEEELRILRGEAAVDATRLGGSRGGTGELSYTYCW